MILVIIDLSKVVVQISRPENGVRSKKPRTVGAEIEVKAAK